MIVHEAVHIWQAVYARNIGEQKPGWTGVAAYAIQAISQELMAEFARQVKEGQ